MEIKKILIIILSIIFVIGIIAYLSANSYVSSTDSFSTRTFGSNDPYSLTTNGSDFWITDGFFGDKFVYHVDRNGVNQTDGFSTITFGSNFPNGITTNGSDFWITDTTDKFVYHVDRNGVNQTDGFSTITFGSSRPAGITTNGSDFWIVDYNTNLGTPNGDKFVYHVDRNGVNQTDGFSISQLSSPEGITTNGSDFWIPDFTSQFVYHVDRNGVNQTDGFQITTSGNNNLGITMNYKNKGTPTDFWIVGTSLSDSLVSHYIPECNPALNQDWIIDGTQICDNREINIGTGNIIITTGHLYLINGANVSIKGINISNSGDKVFINKGSQLRRN